MRLRLRADYLDISKRFLQTFVPSFKDVASLRAQLQRALFPLVLEHQKQLFQSPKVTPF